MTKITTLIWLLTDVKKPKKAWTDLEKKTAHQCNSNSLNCKKTTVSPILAAIALWLLIMISLLEIDIYSDKKFNEICAESPENPTKQPNLDFSDLLLIAIHRLWQFEMIYKLTGKVIKNSPNIVASWKLSEIAKFSRKNLESWFWLGKQLASATEVFPRTCQLQLDLPSSGKRRCLHFDSSDTAIALAPHNSKLFQLICI